MRFLMARLFFCEKSVPNHTRLPLGFAILLWIPMAVAQSNLGELLDAGAKKLSPEEFKDEVVQQVTMGPTATGGSLQVMYASNGMISGTGSYGTVGAATGFALAPINGEWTIDEVGRLCTSMRIGGGAGGGAGPGAILPVRCQFWFKYADQYFLSDSDSDRRTKVLRRTIKQ
jgi:hypothetical protein